MREREGGSEGGRKRKRGGGGGEGERAGQSKCMSGCIFVCASHFFLQGCRGL